MTRRTHRAALVCAVLVATVLVASCSGPAAKPEHRLEPLRSKLAFAEIGVDEVRGDVTALAAQTSRDAAETLDSQRGTSDLPAQNIVFSPWSRARTSRLQSVARGPQGGDDTDRAVAAAIGQAEKWQGDPSDDDSPRIPLLRSRSALIADRSLDVSPAFLDLLSRYYDMGVYLVRQRDPELASAVGGWAEQAARERFGTLPPGLGEPDGVFFADITRLLAAWQQPFDPARTCSSPFTTAQNNRVSPPTMHGVAAVRTAVGRGWRAAQLPLADGLVIRLVIPEDSRSPVRDIVPAAGRALDQALARPTDLALPRWSSRSDIAADGDEPPSRLPAFAPGAVSFGGVSHASVAVAESGLVDTSPPPAACARAAPSLPAPGAFAVDRSFLFEVVDSGTGLVILAGRVADPTK